MTFAQWTDAENRLFAEARIFQSFKDTAGYTLILDRLEERANELLGRVRISKGADYDALQNWRATEETLEFIQNTVNGALKARDELVAGALKLKGFPDDEIEKVIGNYFGAQR